MRRRRGPRSPRLRQGAQKLWTCIRAVQGVGGAFAESRHGYVAQWPRVFAALARLRLTVQCALSGVGVQADVPPSAAVVGVTAGASIEAVIASSTAQHVGSVAAIDRVPAVGPRQDVVTTEAADDIASGVSGTAGEAVPNITPDDEVPLVRANGVLDRIQGYEHERAIALILLFGVPLTEIDRPGQGN